MSINDVTVTEGNTGAVNATFTVSLSVAYDVAGTPRKGDRTQFRSARFLHSEGYFGFLLLAS
jgi:hypothetical protein